MKYRRKTSVPVIILCLGISELVRQAIVNDSLRQALEWMAGVVVAAAASYFLQYWEIQPDRLVFRNFWTKKVWPFSEITYVGPPDGPMAGVRAAGSWIIVRNRQGRRMVDDGWYLTTTRGSHRQFKHPSKAGRVTVAGKPSDDLAPGTLNSILKQAVLKKLR